MNNAIISSEKDISIIEQIRAGNRADIRAKKKQATHPQK